MLTSLILTDFPEKLAEFMEDLEKKRESCEHPNAVRFGPSYTVSGSIYAQRDCYFCGDCLTSYDRNYLI